MRLLEEPLELGTVYVETVTRARELVCDDRTGGGGVRGGGVEDGIYV